MPSTRPRGALNNWPVTGTLITFEPHRSFEHLLPGRDRAFVYVLTGTVTVAGHLVRAGQVAWSDRVPGATVSTIALATGGAEQASVVMVYCGPPIGQPVAMGGPFVMNTKAEITQAFHDLHTGKFGDVPRQALERALRLPRDPYASPEDIRVARSSAGR